MFPVMSCAVGSHACGVSASRSHDGLTHVHRGQLRDIYNYRNVLDVGIEISKGPFHSLKISMYRIGIRL
jgi:hypothetical protein